MGSRLANEIQCAQMSLYERDLASASQTLFGYSFTNNLSAQYLVYPSLIIIWGERISEYLPKQRRHLVSFAGTRLLHLRVLRKLHTKLWFDLNSTLDLQEMAKQVVSGRCLMRSSSHLLRPKGISPPCISFIRFIVVLCL